MYNLCIIDAKINKLVRNLCVLRIACIFGLVESLIRHLLNSCRILVSNYRIDRYFHSHLIVYHHFLMYSLIVPINDIFLLRCVHLLSHEVLIIIDSHDKSLDTPCIIYIIYLLRNARHVSDAIIYFFI